MYLYTIVGPCAQLLRERLAPELPLSAIPTPHPGASRSQVSSGKIHKANHQMILLDTGADAPCEHASEDAPNPAPKRIPNDVIGRLQDHGMAGAYAIWAASYRLEFGDTFAMLEQELHAFAKKLGVVFGGKKWDKSLGLLKQQAVVERQIGGRKKLTNGKVVGRRVRERLGRMNRKKYTTVSARAFDAGPMVFSIVAVIKCNPFPQTFATACRRFGIKSPKTMNKYLEIILDLDEIDIEDKRGVNALVARKGKLQNGKKVTSQTGKKVTSQTGKKVTTQNGKKVTPYSRTNSTSQNMDPSQNKAPGSQQKAPPLLRRRRL